MKMPMNNYPVYVVPCISAVPAGDSDSRYAGTNRQSTAQELPKLSVINNQPETLTAMRPSIIYNNRDIWLPIISLLLHISFLPDCH